MINATDFIEHLKELDYSQFVGVPCSNLKPFINCVIDDDRLDYVGATSEGEAVGIAMGAYLAGRKAVVMCQNSGLGNMVNPLTSLNYPFRIPALLIVTWRGEPGFPDEPQHEQMGQITPRLLETLDIPWEKFPTEKDEIRPVMQKAESYMQERQRPFALVMHKDSVAAHRLSNLPKSEFVATWQDAFVGGQRATRTEAIQQILSVLDGDEVLVATTGKTGRELYSVADRPNHIYVVGGMGTASAIGLGIAHTLPDQPVVVIDGDGAVMMKMGCLATIGFYAPRNLLHIILDNEQHDSTGGQHTSSSVVRFADIAAATNYRNAAFVEGDQELAGAVAKVKQRPGPSLIHVKIRPGSPAELGRPKTRPHEVKDRVMAFLRQRAPKISTCVTS